MIRIYHWWCYQNVWIYEPDLAWEGLPIPAVRMTDPSQISWSAFGASFLRRSSIHRSSSLPKFGKGAWRDLTRPRHGGFTYPGSHDG